MANADRPRGFRPVGNLAGAPWTGKMRPYNVDSSQGTAIFKGDLVKLEDDGNIAPAAAGDRILGVAVAFGQDGFQAQLGNNQTSPIAVNPDNLMQTYHPASTAGTVWVVDDPGTLFEAQSTGTDAVTDIGSLADHVAGAGSTTTGLSAHEISATSSTGVAGLRLLGVVDRPDNDISAANADWIVQIIEHEYNTHIDWADGTPGV